MAESITNLKRSCLAGEVNETMLGKELCLMGWCHKQRDLGSLIFLTLRDRSGEIQLLVNQDSQTELVEKARQVRSEYVIAARGVLQERQDPNPSMPTGLWELKLLELRILSQAKTPPFYIEDGIDTRESLRLEYRYLDMRRPELQSTLMLRHEVVKKTRDWFDRRGFVDIETPTLIKSTPEGARDYLVPSRVFPGEFFALPQSPQIFKQLLMCAGFDRYMQIARCYRDEDLRADRQPEFTQIDVEMSFVQADDVMNLIESFLRELFQDCLGVQFPNPLRRISWKEAMERFGSDKPDTRFGMELHDFSDLAAKTEFKVFQDCLAAGGSVRGLAVPGGASLKRRYLDELTAFVKEYKGRGLVWLSLEKELRGSAVKYLHSSFIEAAAARCAAREGDMLLLLAEPDVLCLDILGRLRLKLAAEQGMIPEDRWDMLWVTEFPMFEYDEEEGRFVAKHHPFTKVMDEDLQLLDSDPAACRAEAYDIVLNGNELGGGSIRIHDQALQEKVFSLLGFSLERARARFGYLLKAFEYGVPPHGGLAIGLDRLMMLMTKKDNIREVLAFPKVQNSSCLMSACPSEVDEKQLTELGIQIRAEVKA